MPSIPATTAIPLSPFIRELAKDSRQAALACTWTHTELPSWTEDTFPLPATSPGRFPLTPAGYRL